ncbi:seipin-like [Argonauta hians]
MIEWSRTLVNWMQDTMQWIFIQLKYTVSKILISITIFIALLWISLFVYGAFYYVYMPSVSHERPCNFVFDVCDDGIGVCSFPKARVELTDESHRYVLSSGQAYKVMLVLEIPESVVNQNSGMFLVKANFFNESNHYIHTSSKTTMLRYKSHLLHTMQTLIYLPFLISGANEEKQVLHVELFSKYTEDPYNRAVGVDFTILHRQVQLYSAAVRIYAHFTGLRYLMFSWPISCAVGGTGVILTVLIMCALITWYNYFNSGYLLHPSSHRILLEERRRQIHARLLLGGHTTPNSHLLVSNSNTRQFQASSVGPISSVGDGQMELVVPAPDPVVPTVTSLALHNVSSSSFPHSSASSVPVSTVGSSAVHSDVSDAHATATTAAGDVTDPHHNVMPGSQLRHRHPTADNTSSSSPLRHRHPTTTSTTDDTPPLPQHGHNTTASMEASS